MSSQITTAMVNQFHKGFELLLQQEGSKLRPYVDVRSQVGEYGYYDFIGKVTAQDLTERHADTTYINTPHSRRRVGLASKVLAELIDIPDEVRLLGNPKNDYQVNFAHAMGRSYDQAIVDAAFGNAYVGKAGGTTVTWGASGTTVSEPATGTSGLTVAKIRSAAKTLNLNHVPDSEKYFVVTANQIDDLLGINEVVSADYNTTKVLMNGDVATFMGFKFISLDADILPKNGNIRDCIAYSRKALLFAIGKDAFSKIEVIPTKNYSTQVYTQATFGATRMDEDRIVKVQCYETP